MACSQTLNGFYQIDCSPSKGGVKEIYIANYDDVTGVTYNSASTIVTGISMASGATFKKYTMRRNTASMTSNLTIDETAGVNYVATDVLIRFNKLDTPQRIEMSALTLAETRVIVLDANGKYWFLGLNEPVVPSSGTAQSGQQKTDGSYYELTLQSSDDTWPIEVTADAVAAVEYNPGS